MIRQPATQTALMRRDEAGVHRGPAPWVRHRLGRVEHEGLGAIVPMTPWWTRTNAIAISEREPVLIQRDDRHHHEEVEVHLGHAVEDVHEHGRGREQRRRGADRPEPAMERSDGCDDREQDDRRGQLRDQAARGVLPPRDEWDRDDVCPRDREDPAVTCAPGGIGQPHARREETAKAAHRSHDTCRGQGVRGITRRVGEFRERPSPSPRTRTDRGGRTSRARTAPSPRRR